MNSVDVKLEEQLKKAGEQLLHPSDSIDELLAVLDQLEKLLIKVYQSPQKSMLEALKPSMKGLIQDSLLKHSDEDVKVSVASCISEITRITAPDAPYNDYQMMDVFQLIVSSFEDIADRSSRSYNKRASILDTVSKVRSCVIMLDLECDGLIVDMFKHFLRSVRDYHFESIYPSMETIMVLILEESEEITDEMLRPLLASVKKDHQGVLPVARKLGEGVLLKSANKLNPCLMQILTSLGESLDMYTKVVASVCEGTTAAFKNNDENASGLQLANESKMEKGSVNGAHQADESKLKTASSDHTEQVVKEGYCTEEMDPTVNRSPKSVMRNGVNVVAKEEASVDQESSKKLEEVVNEKHLNKEDNEVKESDNEEDNDAKELENEEKDNDVKESENESRPATANVSHVSSPKAKESRPATANVSSPSQSNSLPDESCVKKSVRSKKKQVPQKDEIAYPSKSRTPPDETCAKKARQPKSNGSAQDDASKEMCDLDIKPQKRGGKKVVVVKEVKPPPKDESEDDGEATNDSDAKPVRKSKSELTKQSGKKVATGESEAKKPKQSDVMKSKQSGKKGEKSKITDEEEEESDSENKPLKLSAKKNNSKDGVKKRGNDKNVTQKDQAKSLSSDHEMEIDFSTKSATKSGEGNSKETPVSSAKRKLSTSKDKVSTKYDESLIGTKVKVWWPNDNMYYEGVVDAFYSDEKKHKVSYLDGGVEILNLKKLKWKILEQFSSLDEEPTIEAQSDKASPQIHKKKRTKTETASQEKIKDSAKRSKTLASKDKKSKDNSKETGKSKEDEETPRSKTTSKSKGKTPQTSGKSDTDGPTKRKPGSSNEKEPEAEKTTESTKSGLKSRKKRKLREGVLLRSANKLQSCLMQFLTSLGESLDTKVVDSVCEDTTATFENNDENASGLQLANESKMEKESVEGAHQADESKLKTTLSDHTEQVVKEGETFTISAPSTTIDMAVLQNMRPPQPAGAAAGSAGAGRADPVGTSGGDGGAIEACCTGGRVSPQTAKTERPSVQVVCQSSMCGRLDQMERIQRLGFNHTQARLDYLQTLYRLAIPYETTLPPPPTIDPLYASFLSEAGTSTRDREDQDQEQAD